MAPLDLSVTRVARFETGVFKGGGAEVVVHDNGKFYATNAAANAVDIYTVAGGRIGSLSLAGVPNGGGVTSVAAKDGLIAVAVTNADEQAPGFVALFTADDADAPAAILTVGVLPDMLTFTPSGEIVVAIEGQPADDGANDPLGGVSVITPNRAAIGLSTVETYDFTAFDRAEAQLRADGVRIRPGAAASRDFEPEYIAVDPQTGNLFVTLQENNAVAVFDMAQRAFTRAMSLGTTDHSLPGQGIDPSDRDGAADVRQVPVQGLRMADAIATFVHEGVTFYATANEGDGRDYAFFKDEARVRDVLLDPVAFPDAAALRNNAALGRLTVSAIDGDADGDGDLDQLFSFGSRSFTIFDADGNEIFDSGSQFEDILAAQFPTRFNVNNAEPFDVDNRSDNKGPEPEAIAIAEVDGRRLALIGLERANGVMIYDITDPAAATFLTYIDPVVDGDGSTSTANLLRSDLGPETITVVSALESASGLTEFAVASEISGTVSVYTLDFVPRPQNFTLQILHASDLEGGVDAIERAPSFAAIVDALEQDAADRGWASILLSAGDNYLPGPFAGAAGDPALRAVLDSVYEQFYGQTYDIRESIARVDIAIMNLLGFDASAIGNHEFDFGATEFLSLVNDDVRGALSATRWLGTFFPYLSANLDFSGQPGFTDGPDPVVTDAILPNTAFAPNPADPLSIDAAPKIAKATTIERDGERIGVVGAATQRVVTISSTNNVAETTSNGVDDMAALAAALQPVIDDLINGADDVLGTSDDVNKVILVSHLQDINLEKQLAGLLRGVDVIIAGGSDTRLADETDRLREGDAAEGDYPFVATDANGDPLLIVSTDGEYSHVGRLVVEFDRNGRLVSLGDGFTDPAVSGAYVTDDQGVTDVTGAATAQEAIDASERADLIERLVDAAAAVVTANDGNIFGRTSVFIEGRREFVRTEETTLGNLSADANLAYAKSVDPTVVVSIKNGGGIRAAIGEVDGLTGALLPTSANPAAGKEAGELSQLDIQNALRFNNGLTLLSLSSADLAAVLEHAVASTGPGSTPGQFPQVSGVRFSFDASRPVGDRIVNAGVFAEDGALIAEIVRDGAVVENPGRSFRVVTLNFLAGGGDGYPFPALGEDRVDLVDNAAPRTGVATFAADGSEQDAFAEFLAQNFAVTPFAAVETGPEGDERIQNLAFRADAVFEDVTTPDEIFMSEIVEGSSFNKAVELYNLTGAAIDLSSYVLQFFFNGASTAGTTIALTGAIGARETFVIADSRADAAILAVANQTSTANFFNGDDAIVLSRAGVVIDAFGTIGVDPGAEWPGGGQNDTLRRKDGILVGDADAADPFDAADEWDVFPQDDFSDLGNHGVRPAAFDLQVTEIWPGQNGADVTEDWFEITNFGSGAWTAAIHGALYYDDDSENPVVADLIQGIASIAAGESVIVVIGGASDAAAFTAVWADDSLPVGTQVGFTDGAGLGQGGDAVALFLDAENDGLAPTDTPFETEAFPDARAASGRSWEVAAQQFASLRDFADTVATTELGGDGTEPAIGSPGFIPTPNLGPELTLISAVQGAGAESPLVGQTVTVQGVVIGDYDDANELRGFFLQEEDSDADGDAATSEGVFVFVGAGAANVSEGQRVTVTGVVAEFFGMTQIVAAADGVTIDDAGNNLALVTPTVLNRADFGANEDASAFEAVEGMLVTFADTLTVSEYFQLERFGQVVLYAGGRPNQFTQDNAPDVEGFAAHRADLAGRRVILDDTNNINNGALVTDRVFHPQPDGFGVGVQGEDFFRGGDEVVSLTGVMHWSFAGSSGADAWRVRPTEAAPAVFTPVNTREDNAAPPAVGGALTVASFNVLNFFATIDVAGAGSGPNNLAPRGADSMAELDRQLAKLTEALALMNADIVALVELENDADDASARLIVDSLNAVLGEGTYTLIETGFVGGDAIKVGYIYKPGSVTPVGETAILDDAAFVDPAGTGQDRNRPAIAVSWQENASGEIVTTVANHLKSKGAGGAAGLDLDQQDGAGAFNHTRTLAAEALIAWLSTNPTGVDDPDVLVLGDLNSYARETPIVRFEDAGFTNLKDAFDPDSYGYLFDGQLGTLDYALSSATLTGQVAGAAGWRINADEVPLFDYNDTVRDPGEQSFERRPGGNALFAPDQWRTSDHDPVLVGLSLRSEPALQLVEGTGGNDTLLGLDGDELFRGLGGRRDVITTGLGADTIEFGAWVVEGPRSTTLITDFDAGRDTVAFVDGAEIVDWRETGSGLTVIFGNNSTATFTGLREADAHFLPFDDALLV